MKNDRLIPASEFCRYYHVEDSFINSLHDYGLVEITTIEHNHFINAEKLAELEKFTRLHYDLDINLEGIEVINYMLQKIRDLQQEIVILRQRLQFYEN
jgi:vacuolar-type H+-ATPase subunit I/STV1